MVSYVKTLIKLDQSVFMHQITPVVIWLVLETFELETFEMSMGHW